MRLSLPSFGLALLVAGCSESITGRLEVRPLDEGRALEVTFVPDQSALEPGKVYLEFQAVGARLVLSGSTGSSAGCVPLPSNRRLVVLADGDGLPPGSRVRVSAWHFEPPEAPRGSMTPVAEVPLERRCTGVLIADAAYSEPPLPDAGVLDASAPDTGPAPLDGGASDGGVDGGGVDGAAPDAAGADAGEPDASLGVEDGGLDAGTSTTSADAGV
jgi:hypothetical protein